MSAKRPAQRCPICRALQPLEATRCNNCGAALNGIPSTGPDGAPRVLPTKPQPRNQPNTPKRPVQPLGGSVAGDWEDGDSDLHEGTLPGLTVRTILLGMATVIVIGFIGLLLGVQAGVISFDPTRTPLPTSTPTDIPTLAVAVNGTQPTIPPTNTKPSIPTVMPTLDLPTVTLAPPTPTITPTQGPCMQTAGKNDTVYGMAARCGHKHLSIVALIVQNNALKDANSLQEGQTLEIPWPTPTGGAPEEGDAAAKSGDAASGEDGVAVEQLPPGVQWYTVIENDTAISIAYQHQMTMKALRDLNPEIQFLQCDFSVPSGGPACTLRPMIGIGQKLRVAVPQPTPTMSPTYTGSETATPTGTATFNALFSQSPDNNMLYESSELPALRWVASAQLDPTEVYLVTIRDLTTGAVYTATTKELSFQVPLDWQPTDGTPHKFEWVVAVATQSEGGSPEASTLTTEARTFTWHSKSQ
jgi:hypothetical protein